MYRRTESGERIFWCLLESDVQNRAEVRIKRKLTEDELRTVQKGLESGLGSWYEIMDLAINLVICPVWKKPILEEALYSKRKIKLSWKGRGGGNNEKT